MGFPLGTWWDTESTWSQKMKQDRTSEKSSLNLNLKLLSRREVGEGERGCSACHSNRSTPRTRAGFPERAVLDVVLRVQRGDRRLPSQAYSVVLPMISCQSAVIW